MAVFYAPRQQCFNRGEKTASEVARLFHVHDRVFPRLLREADLKADEADSDSDAPRWLVAVALRPSHLIPERTGELSCVLRELAHEPVGVFGDGDQAQVTFCRGQEQFGIEGEGFGCDLLGQRVVRVSFGPAQELVPALPQGAQLPNIHCRISSIMVRNSRKWKID